MSILSSSRFKGYAVTSAVFAVFFLFAGCKPGPEEAAPPQNPVVNESNADLVIALLPERNVFEQKLKYLPLQDYLSKSLGISVYFKLLDNYEQIFTELLDGKVDGGFWGSMNGAIAQLRGGIEVLARPVWEDGSSTYSGVVYARKGNDITADPQTWKGKSIAFVNVATTAGFLYPLSMMREAGITEDPADFFSRAVFSGSHDASILAVYQGDVEMGASKNTIFNEFLERNPEIADSIEVVAQSVEVPSNGLGVRPTLSDDLKARLKGSLVSMDKNAEGLEALKRFGALRFVATSFDDYKPVIEMAEKAGIDLAQWPLRDARGPRPYR